MTKLLKIEFKKVLTYKVFWILFGLYFLFLASGILLAEFMVNHMVDSMNHHLGPPIIHYPELQLLIFPLFQLPPQETFGYLLYVVLSKSYQMKLFIVHNPFCLRG